MDFVSYQQPVKPRTPKKIDAQVKELIRLLGLKHTNASFLPYTHKSDTYRATYCYNNCEDEVATSGGEMVFGWIVWVDKKARFCEAEHHCVVRQDNKLFDISPRQHSSDKLVLFVPDATREGGRIGSNLLRGWSSLKMSEGEIIAHVKKLKIEEIDSVHSAITEVE